MDDVLKQLGVSGELLAIEERRMADAAVEGRGQHDADHPGFLSISFSIRDTRTRGERNPFRGR